MDKILEFMRGWAWKYIGTLVMEVKSNGKMAMSLGRVTFLAVLVQFFIVWYKSLNGVDVALPPGLMEVFYVISGYTLGTKVVQAVRLKYQNGKLDTLEGDRG